ncbi:hypothetical protein LJR016_004291 [Devosia sp. LjRoot16]|jgi:hypothetical protein|uniref:hypothetical protein n=1 Tax=Devosia sp. LjRoot16 TaxID=3342271 RepID=UPI003ECC7749
MREARQLSAGDYAGLKSAFRQLVGKFGKQDHAASVTRVRQQDISRYGSTDEDDAERFAPIDVIADLESEVGPVVTRELARMNNHVLVPLPAINASRGPLGRITAEALKEVSDVFSKMGQALADETLTSVEGAQLDTEIDEAIEKLLALKAQIDFEAGRAGR